MNNLIVGQFIMNSLRNKFLSVKELLSQNLNLLIINETKLDDRQFLECSLLTQWL